MEYILEDPETGETHTIGRPAFDGIEWLNEDENTDEMVEMGEEDVVLWHVSEIRESMRYDLQGDEMILGPLVVNNRSKANVDAPSEDVSFIAA